MQTPDAPKRRDFDPLFDVLLWPVGLARRIQRARREGRTAADGMDDFFYAHTSPNPLDPTGRTRLAGGKLYVPVRTLLPIMMLIGAIVLSVLSFILPLVELASSTGAGAGAESLSEHAQLKQYVLLGGAGITALLAVLALAIKQVRGWLGLASLAAFASTLVALILWFAQSG